MSTSVFAMMRRVVAALVCKPAVLAFCVLFGSLLLGEESALAQVTLSSSTIPTAAEPNVQSVRVTGSGFPAGAISASSITVSLVPGTTGSAPGASTTASGFARIAGTTATVTFTVPSSLVMSSPTPYLVSIAGTTAGGVAFSSTNTANLTIDPPARVALVPATGKQGQSLSIAINGTFSNFAQGATTANFGPGISVGGAAANSPGPVTVTSATSASAQIAIAANASVQSNPVVIATGNEIADSTFSVTSAVGAAASITATAGTPQSAAISTAFATALQATVKDSGGNPVSGVVVTFAAPATGASGSFAGGVVTATTNASGIATAAVFTANSTAGSYSVTASAPGVGTPATFALTNTTGAAASITATAGTPQSAAINTAFATALQATVKDSGGNPVSGVVVTFAAPATGASGTFAGGVVTATTNASGVATAATFTANSTAGSYSVTASVAGVTAHATYALTNTTGAAASITATAGTPQSAAINTAFATALQATVKDSGGNPVSGVTVTFAAPATGASGTFAGGVVTATTNASGVATAAVFTANSTAGSYSVTASAPGVGTPATFALTNTTGAAASITATAGTPQSAAINTAFATALQATVKDSGGNPVSGVVVTFAAPATGASGSFAGGVVTATTNASGVATAAVFTANSTAGSYNVTASAPGVTAHATFALTNTTGAAASITATAGTPQSAAINTAFATALQATVKDSGGNPVSGVVVTFAAPATGASGSFAGGVVTATTNASGVATAAVFTANSTAGSYSVTASAPGVGTPATFALTNTTGAAASITATAGTPQSAAINTAFATALQATVKDSSGNPVSGVVVTFAAPATGASGTFAGGVVTATTNASGVATAAVFTANSTAGSYSVTASAPGVTSHATYALTNTPGTPASITATAGTPQSAAINTAFATALQATVKDSGGNPVSGVVVTFAAPATGASGSFAGGVVTATTNASGVATAAVFTANSTAGSYSVTASAPGVGTPATFALTNTPGTPASITATAGTPQSATINTAFASALQATVKDSGGNPVSGVVVTFAAPATGASGTFAGGVVTATTNTAGIATSATFTANGTIGTYQVTASVSGVTNPAVFTLTNTTPTITTLAPSSGALAQTLNVVVTGSSTHFVQGTTTAFFGTGITVNTVTVASSTSATVNITIAPTTSLGARTVTMTTGTEVATDTNGFDVTQGSAAITSLNPNSGAQGTQANVIVTGTNTNFAQGQTTANFGPNIGINSVTVSSLTSATVSITIAGNATVGAQTVSLTTGGEVASLTNGFTVTAGTAQITNVNPPSGNQGDTADSITITGQSTHWVQGTTTASFGTGISVTSLTVNSATSATAVIAIAANAPIGNRTVTLTTNSEVANSSPTAFSVAAGVPSATANPNFGVQGTNPTIVINGAFTSFVPGTTTVTFNDSNITVGTVTVNGPTQLSVPIAISTAAVVGGRTIVISTNGISVDAAFNVVAGIPSITLINPNNGVPNSSATVTITGNFTGWKQGTTLVSFGSGIAVGGGASGAAGPVTVNNPGSITASIAIANGATLGGRTVTVTTGTEVESVPSGFTVQTCTTTAATSILYNPAQNATNVPLNPEVQIEFNAPLNRSSVTASDFVLHDNTTGVNLPATISVDASGRIITLTPSVLLAVGRQFYTEWGNFGSPNQITDTCGNLVAIDYYYFTTTFAADTTGPTVLANSPEQGDTVSESAQVVLKFSAPINPITQPTGLVVSTGGTPVAGTYTPSPDYTQYTFVPGSPLAANAVYTVTYTNALQDGAGNALADPGSFTFTTDSSTDTANGTVTYADPYNGQTGVSTNVQPAVYFSKPVDPITVNTSVFYLEDAETGRRIPATVSVAPNRLSAAIAPLQLLQANTYYYFILSYPVYDLSGNYFEESGQYFYTGSGSVTAVATVAAISPSNGETGAPVNTQVVAVMSAPVDGGSISNSSITVKSGSTPVAGKVTLASDFETLTFVPTANLSVSTTYTVTVGGFLDGNGNAVANSTTTFATSSSGTPQTGALTAVSVSPANGATEVANNAQVTITFSAPVDPATINNILVRDQSDGYYEISGTWAVSGSNPAQVIFTPSSPYPASAMIQVWTQDKVQDLAGDTDTAYVVTTFTAAPTADTSAFQVVSISPSNGATGVGRNATIVITFNKSVAQNSINGVANSLQLFAGDKNIGTGGITFSADDKSISFTPTTPPGVGVTINATPLITDLSGNPLVNFTSAYTTLNDITATGPAIVQMLPASGSSDVLQGVPITLYTNGAPLQASTVNNTSVYVSQNGVLVEGAIQVSPGGQSITFTPTGQFNYSAVVQVFVEPTITDIYGNAITAFTGQFTIQGNPSSVAPQLVRSEPINDATGVPLNVVPQFQFDQTLLASSVSSTSVRLIDSCNDVIPGTPSLVNGNTVQFKPTSPLTLCNTATGYNYFYFQMNDGFGSNVTNLNGVAAPGESYYFYVGTTSDTSIPTVVSVAPPPGAINVGVNAVIWIQFSEFMNPISLNGTTVQISGGSQTAVPATISFDSTGTIAAIQPEIPLPANTAMTITVNGVTNLAGTPVTPYTSTFNTGAAAVTAAPLVINESIANGAVGVPTNVTASVQFNQPMAPNSFTAANFYLYDTVLGKTVPTTTTVSTDGTTATLTPLSPLLVNRQYYYLVDNVRGVTGNTAGESYWYFTTQSTTSALLPIVTVVNPSNTLTNVPTNTIIEILFNEPIAPDTISGVTVTPNGGSAISTTASFDTTNTLLSLTPSTTLLPNTTYTISVTGVVDQAGQAQTSAFSSTFTTSGSSDISNGSVTYTVPVASDTNVALNVHPTFYFSKLVNPLSATPAYFYLRNYTTGAIVPTTISVAANQLSATLTPTANLQPNTEYYLYGYNFTDVAGNTLNGTAFYFITGASATTTGASVVSISPPNGQTGTPLNTQVVAVMSAPVNQGSFGSSPITVKTGSTAVPGTTTLATDQETLTWAPTAPLAAGVAYNVTVGGFSDQNGNTVQTGTSSFTTGSAIVGAGALVAVSVTPANGTTLSSNTTPVVITFSEPIDPSTVGNILVRDESLGYYEIAGSWSVSGAVATFTPLSPYPANHVIQVWTQDLVRDFAGNTDTAYIVTTFTAANSADTTSPTVTSVTPANNATGVGDVPPIVLTFSKSMNQTTLNTNSIAVFAADSQFTYSLSFPTNGRSVVVNLNTTLPPSTLITVSASAAAQDLSGNALVPFQSTFTTGAAIPPQTQGPRIVTLIPANGATDVPQGTAITLYASGFPLSASTLNGNSFQVSANGQLVSGNLTLVGTNAIQFTPTSALPYSALVQIYVTNSLTDTYGNPLLANYTGTFTVQGNPTTVAPQLVRYEPANGATNVLLNVVPQFQFDQTLLASSVTSTSVRLIDSCNDVIAGTPSLVNGNTVQFKPSSPLTLCNTASGYNYFYFQMNDGFGTNVTNLDGIAAPGESYYFYTGTTTNTTRPTVTAIGPLSGTQNVGVNATVYVQFSAPINPLSVSGTSIAITSSSETEVPATYSFNSTNTIVGIQPLMPLTPNATITVAVSGVTDDEGNVVVPTSSTFTTAAGPDLTTPTVIAVSYTNGDTIPLNTTAFSITFNEPMDPLSVNPATFYLYDETQTLTVTPVSITAASDMETFILTIPSGTLHSGDAFYVLTESATDISGNVASEQYWTATVGSTSDTTAPVVTELNPQSGLTGSVPTNTQPQLEFSKEISDVSAQTGIQLLQGGTPVPATVTLSRGNKVATITPNDPLSESTTYTISATGVQDIQGTPMASAYTSNFTTSASGINLLKPTLVSVTPANGTISVPTSVNPVVVFNTAMNPLTFDQSIEYAFIWQTSNDVIVPATVSFSADGKTVTFIPTAALTSNTEYTIEIGYEGYVTDVAGNQFSPGSYTMFTTQ